MALHNSLIVKHLPRDHLADNFIFMVSPWFPGLNYLPLRRQGQTILTILIFLCWLIGLFGAITNNFIYYDFH